MKKFKEKAFLVLLAVIFLSILICPNILDMPDIYLIDKNKIDFSGGWTWKGDGYKDEFSLPYRFAVKKTEPLVIKNTLPGDLPAGSVMAMKSNMQSVAVKIDGKKVYEVGTDSDEFLGRDFGEFWACIKIEPEYEGKEIETSLFSHRTASHGSAPEVFIGSESAVFGQFFSQRGLWNVFALIILILGIITILAYFIFGIYKEKNRSLLYLGIFALIMGNWFFGESGMLQLFTANTYYTTRISLLMTLVAPISACLYISEAVPMKRRFFEDFLTIFIIINAVVCLGLEYFGILGLSDTIFGTIVLIVVMCVYYLTILFIESIVYKNKKALKELKSLSVLFIFSLLEIVSYFINHQKISYLFMSIGVLIYVATMIVSQFSNYREIRSVREERVYFERMAYTDAMTGANNRAKYMEDIENFPVRDGTIVVQADTDRLKHINDSFGHSAGDKSIIDTYEVLNNNFGHIGKVYRTGGDEFAVIIENANKKKINTIVEEVRKDVSLINKEREYDFSISMGMAEYNASLDKDLYSTTLRADKEMYEDKKRLRNRLTNNIRELSDNKMITIDSNLDDTHITLYQ